MWDGWEQQSWLSLDNYNVLEGFMASSYLQLSLEHKVLSMSWPSAPGLGP